MGRGCMDAVQLQFLQERCLSLGKHHIEFNVGNVYQLRPCLVAGSEDA